MLLLLSVRSPHKINQAPCSGLMSVFPWLRDGLLIRKAGVNKGVSVEPGWGLDFEHDNEPSATPSLETQPQHSENLLQSRVMPCPEQLRGAVDEGVHGAGGDSPGGLAALQELVGIVSPDRQLLNLAFPQCWGYIRGWLCEWVWANGFWQEDKPPLSQTQTWPEPGVFSHAVRSQDCEICQIYKFIAQRFKWVNI